MQLEQNLRRQLEDKVTIAMGTFNGAKHIGAQLSSFDRQTFKNWDLWISDDGSDDETLSVVKDWAERWDGHHVVRVIRGPGRGSAQNFLSMLDHPDFPNGFVALSDQDDVWHSFKISQALYWMNAHGADLYGAQSIHVNEVLKPTGQSLCPQFDPSFKGSLVQNLVSGHSLVLAPAGLEFLRKVGRPHQIAHHDWWIYQLMLGSGRKVFIDQAAVLAYRQHNHNLMGAHSGLIAGSTRLLQLLNGRFKEWVDVHLAALWAHKIHLTEENAALVEQLRQNRAPADLWENGVRRQDGLGTFALYLAAVLGRI